MILSNSSVVTNNSTKGRQYDTKGNWRPQESRKKNEAQVK